MTKQSSEPTGEGHGSWQNTSNWGFLGKYGKAWPPTSEPVALPSWCCGLTRLRSGLGGGGLGGRDNPQAGQLNANPAFWVHLASPSHGGGTRKHMVGLVGMIPCLRSGGGRGCGAGGAPAPVTIDLH